MDKLSREEVEHVAYLARIELTPQEIEKFRVQLKTLMDEIDKIKDIKDYDEDIMFTPVNHDTILRDDVEGEMLDYKTALKNAPRTSGNFVEVPVMIGE
jgi:aspartyl-tRNA(Asn)/glutamyl-tRNA(Gln) amidotransferase subunit C